MNMQTWSTGDRWIRDRYLKRQEVKSVRRTLPDPVFMFCIVLRACKEHPFFPCPFFPLFRDECRRCCKEAGVHNACNQIIDELVRFFVAPISKHSTPISFGIPKFTAMKFLQRWLVCASDNFRPSLLKALPLLLRTPIARNYADVSTLMDATFVHIGFQHTKRLSSISGMNVTGKMFDASQSTLLHRHGILQPRPCKCIRDASKRPNNLPPRML